MEMQDPKKSPKSRHLGTIAQLCRVYLRNWGTYRQSKKIVIQQCLPQMSSQYGVHRPTSRWDLLASLGHPCKLQRVSRLRSVTARHSSSEHRPNFAALNRGCHLYSARRPSRWALAHISSKLTNTFSYYIARCVSYTVLYKPSCCVLQVCNGCLCG